MTRIKPIRRLYHQFGGYMIEPRLDAHQIFEALKSAGLVESVEDGISYRETKAMKEILDYRFKTVIQDALVQYCKVSLGLEFSQMRLSSTLIDTVVIVGFDEWRGEIKGRDIAPSEKALLGLTRHNTNRILEVTGSFWIDERFKEIKAKPIIWVWHKGLHIETDLVRFDEYRLNDVLNERFSWLGYYKRLKSSRDERLYDESRDGE